MSATGRECSTGLNSGTPWHEDNAFRCLDYTSTNNYKRTYSYDKLGNILQLEHDVTSGSGTDFTRNYIYPSGNASNKLESLENASSSTVADYTYDASGNQIGEGTSRYFTWNHQNQLKTFFIQGSNGSEPSFYSIYLYGSNGQRVKKFTRASSTLYRVSNYIGQSYEHLYNANGSLVVDDSNNNFDWYSMFLGSERVNSERYGNDAEPKAGASDFLEYVNDHLGSVVLTYNSTSGILHSREECFPFGENAFGGYAKKRYRFTGKERDDGSGLYYFGARYYAPWLCRFTSVDPLAAKHPNKTPYHYTSNNPINRTDPTGMEDTGGGGGKTNNTVVQKAELNIKGSDLNLPSVESSVTSPKVTGVDNVSTNINVTEYNPDHLEKIQKPSVNFDSLKPDQSGLTMTQDQTSSMINVPTQKDLQSIEAYQDRQARFGVIDDVPQGTIDIPWNDVRSDFYKGLFTTKMSEQIPSGTLAGYPLDKVYRGSKIVGKLIQAGKQEALNLDADNSMDYEDFVFEAIDESTGKNISNVLKPAYKVSEGTGLQNVDTTEILGQGTTNDLIIQGTEFFQRHILK